MWVNPIRTFRVWLDAYEVENPHLARWLCRLIPNRCPFERRFQIGPYDIHIPPLCYLNPFYAQCVRIRCKAMLCLATLEGEV